MTLEGKVVLVTGAAKRVGKAVAEACARRGARVAVHYRRSAREAKALSAALRDRYGVKTLAVQADLENAREIPGLVKAVARGLGGLDVLVNSASIYEETPFGRATAADWDRHMNANARAPFLLAQAAAPFLRRAGTGKIVNIADWSALRPYAGYAPYCASKAALLCVNAALAKALAPRVQVNAVMPGPVLLPEGTTRKKARLIAQATLLKRLGRPEDAAQAVLYFIERGDFVTGTALPVDGGRLAA